jgi:redox-sensitive bicupin YhaK (pirin superfamily)
MSTTRRIKALLRSKPTLEGAGVHLKRAFGYQQSPQMDPFLLLDDFHSDDPHEYLPGFPWHPHRGIETITYVLHGEVQHGDSLGNSGVISSGDVQWMTAGSGIIHQEMPKGQDQGLLWGFQLWANLPASYKMMAPRYRDVTRERIPEVELEGGTKVKVICGKVGNVRGPVRDVVIDPEYLDVDVPPEATFTHRVPVGYTVLAYVIQGQGYFEPVQGSNGSEPVGTERLVVYGDGHELAITAEATGVRFLLISGRPIEEPVAWRGPIVMNTQEELRIAFEEYQRGTFLKHGKG